MQLVVMILTLLMPFLQVGAQFGAHKVQENIRVRQQQSQPVATQPMMQGPSPAYTPQPPRYHFDGARWYKYENGQVYVWNGNGPPSI